LTERRRGFWSGLLEGASRPSWTALVGSLAVGALWILLALVLVTPETLADHGGGFLAVGDGRTRLTGEVLRLRREADDRPLVLLVGVSSLEEALTHPDDLEARIVAELGSPVRVVPLMVGELLPAEVVAILDAVPAGRRGALVLTAGPRMLSHPRWHLEARLGLIRFGFDSEAFREEVARTGLEPLAHRGIYALDHLDFLLTQRPTLERRLLGRPTRPFHPFDGQPPPTDEEIRTRVGWNAGRKSDYEENREAGLETLGRAVELLRAKGDYEVIVLRPPRNPRLAPVTHPPELAASHEARLRRFAAEIGASLLDTRAGVELTEADFHDHVHLSSRAARERFTAWLAESLAEALR
jgi:hypothetical protein